MECQRYIFATKGDDILRGVHDDPTAGMAHDVMDIDDMASMYLHKPICGKQGDQVLHFDAAFPCKICTEEAGCFIDHFYAYDQVDRNRDFHTAAMHGRNGQGIDR